MYIFFFCCEVTNNFFLNGMLTTFELGDDVISQKYDLPFLNFVCLLKKNTGSLYLHIMCVQQC